MKWIHRWAPDQIPPLCKIQFFGRKKVLYYSWQRGWNLFLNFCIELSSVKKCSLSEELTGYSESERKKKNNIQTSQELEILSQGYILLCSNSLDVRKGFPKQSGKYSKKYFSGTLHLEKTTITVTKITHNQWCSTLCCDQWGTPYLKCVVSMH